MAEWRLLGWSRGDRRAWSRAGQMKMECRVGVEENMEWRWLDRESLWGRGRVFTSVGVSCIGSEARRRGLLHPQWSVIPTPNHLYARNPQALSPFLDQQEVSSSKQLGSLEILELADEDSEKGSWPSAGFDRAPVIWAHSVRLQHCQNTVSICFIGQKHSSLEWPELETMGRGGRGLSLFFLSCFKAENSLFWPRALLLLDLPTKFWGGGWSQNLYF